MVRSTVAVTGTTWARAEQVAHSLDRILRTTPNFTLVTQQHFLRKVAPWAKSHLVILEYVQAPNRYAANEQLLRIQPTEVLLFETDPYVQHLATVLRNGPASIPVRQYLTP